MQMRFHNQTTIRQKAPPGPKGHIHFLMACYTAKYNDIPVSVAKGTFEIYIKQPWSPESGYQTYLQTRAYPR